MRLLVSIEIIGTPPAATDRITRRYLNFHEKGVNPIMTEFGEKLKALRIELNLTQKDLAIISGISHRTIFNYENGVSAPKKRDTYLALAQALDVGISALLDDEEEFILQAGKLYGKRGRQQAKETIADINRMFQEKNIPEEDRAAVRDAIIQAYWIAKEDNRKFVNKRFL